MEVELCIVELASCCPLVVLEANNRVAPLLAVGVYLCSEKLTYLSHDPHVIIPQNIHLLPLSERHGPGNDKRRWCG